MYKRRKNSSHIFEEQILTSTTTALPEAQKVYGILSNQGLRFSKREVYGKRDSVLANQRCCHEQKAKKSGPKRDYGPETKKKK